MKHTLTSRTLLAAALAALLPLAAVADDLPLDLKGFEIIVQRNIFDPARTTPQAARTAGPVVVYRPTNISTGGETMTLTGAVVVQGVTTAIFASTSPVLSGLRQVGETIGEWQVTAVDTDGATLTRDGTPTRLTVGTTLARAKDGSWQESRAALAPLAAAAPTVTAVGSSAAPATGATAAATGPTTAPSAAPAAGAAATAAPPAGATSAEELIKRLRERRQKELQP